MDLSKKICRQALVRLNGSKMSLCAIFPSPLKLREEKNWSPLIIGDNLYFAYSIDPFVLFKFAEGKLNLVGKKPLSHENIRLRGGSQFVHWKNETYISIAHRQRIKTHKIHYLHEFVVFDSKHMDLIETSEPFFLHKRGIEFAAGMIRCHNSIVISYGVSDALSVSLQRQAQSPGRPCRASVGPLSPLAESYPLYDGLGLRESVCHSN